MTAKRLRKYWIHLRFSAHRTFGERSELVGRMALIPLFLGVLSALWKSVSTRQLPFEVSSTQMVWYLATTQWVLFSVPHPEFELEQQIRRGDVTYQLVRPISLLGVTLAEGLGTLLVQSPLFALGAFGSAWLFSGELPRQAQGAWLVLPLGLLGSLALFSFQVALGISAFWFRNIAPLGWIWSKATFVLGGLMLPLPIYPSWLERVALTTPFAQSLYGPGSLLFSRGASGVDVLSKQLLWFGIGVVLCWRLEQNAIQTLTVDGG